LQKKKKKKNTKKVCNFFFEFRYFGIFWGKKNDDNYYTNQLSVSNPITATCIPPTPFEQNAAIPPPLDTNVGGLRLQIASDLHIEFGYDAVKAVIPKAPYLALIGDIGMCVCVCVCLCVCVYYAFVLMRMKEC